MYWPEVTWRSSSCIRNWSPTNKVQSSIPDGQQRSSSAWMKKVSATVAGSSTYPVLLSLSSPFWKRSSNMGLAVTTLIAAVGNSTITTRVCGGLSGGWGLAMYKRIGDCVAYALQSPAIVPMMSANCRPCSLTNLFPMCTVRSPYVSIHIKSETCINGDPGSKVQSLPINSVSRYVPWQTVGANLPKHVERPSNHKRFSESLDKMILGVRSLGDYCDTPIQREF